MWVHGRIRLFVKVSPHDCVGQCLCRHLRRARAAARADGLAVPCFTPRSGFRVLPLPRLPRLLRLLHVNLRGASARAETLLRMRRAG